MALTKEQAAQAIGKRVVYRDAVLSEAGHLVKLYAGLTWIAVVEFDNGPRLLCDILRLSLE